MKKRNMPVMLIALCLTVLAVYQATEVSRSAEASAAAGGRPQEMVYQKPVPAFTLKGLDGQQYRVGGPREKPLLINFWASWCGPCLEEAPDLKRVYDKYGGQFDLYSVNVTREDQLDDVKRFVKQHELAFPILLDSEGTTAEMYRILVVPTSFLVDRQGNLREVIHVLPPDMLEKRIQALIQG
ncbi:Sporulation thiol-disulfide oxidoreductase A precursor [Paenibacillus konkukensis]|uniref:Sporulation thiol-disulfide oxidoreductase A n=1 Tax=Paenibacillus konkukensis TaxID=2020716 RepID=A0ABY4RLN8_9BACL|nr:TlpA disulfide reductase family protein [Paenibacillus konkukensis]UQZ82796.1 Sporulation thiol-disulfide oxidoreductase A precursor [Paenibacillus konkukensis]